MMQVHELQRQSVQPLVTEPIQQQNQQNSVKVNNDFKSFDSILNETMIQPSGLKFSAHAMKRMDERQIPITAEELARLQNGVDQAEAKGAVNSLVMVDNSAYIVSVKNKTVVTAVPQVQNQGNVFTNIDSVAIV